jgi:VanZ family protein
MKAMKKRTIIYYIPAFVMMFIIFNFSTQNGTQSGSLSDSIYYFINGLIHLPLSKDLATFIIRKCAHMTEYGVYALTLLYAFKHTKKLKLSPYPLSVVCAFLYACTDEMHQFFVSGRSAQFRDVMIDTCGALLFILVAYLIHRVRERS